jgi:hypothetical protein
MGGGQGQDLDLSTWQWQSPCVRHQSMDIRHSEPSYPGVISVRYPRECVVIRHSSFVRRVNNHHCARALSLHSFRIDRTEIGCSNVGGGDGVPSLRSIKCAGYENIITGEWGRREKRMFVKNRCQAFQTSGSLVRVFLSFIRLAAR